MEVRRARSKADFAAVLELQLLCLPKDEPRGPTEGMWWLVFDGRRAVACACLALLEGDPPGAYLARAGVHPEYQGKGLQRRLIRVREAAARRAGRRVVISDTSETNYTSANNLMSCGYRLYNPVEPWGLPHGMHWRKEL